MSCDYVQEQISPFLDRRISAEEKDRVAAHLEACRSCKAHFESIESLRQDLGGMRRAPVPASLAMRLRVVASHERQRQILRADFALRMRRWLQTVQLAFDHLMRPFALPFAGGLSSAVACFSLLISILSFPHNFRDASFFTHPDGTLVVQTMSGTYLPTCSNDVCDLPRIELEDAEIPGNANVVLLTIDARGRVSDWAVERGKVTPDIQDLIMFSTFVPATYLGAPTSGRVKAVQFASGRGLRS
jgi:hypothetical protein